MTQSTLATGVVHAVPADLKQMLLAAPKIKIVWNTITPLARNEWICWITSAKKPETRERRMRIMGENLPRGKHRPCCWAGCPHR